MGGSALRIAIVGNCQVGALKKAFDAANLEINAVSLETWNIVDSDLPGVLLEMDNSDCIVIQPHSAKRFGPLLSDNVKERFGGKKPLVFIHNLFFTGPVPDCVSIPNPVRSLMAGYHSRTVIAAYLAGRARDAAMASFLMAEGIDVKKTWDQSLHRFRERQKAVDVKFDEEIDHYVRERQCFHTFNHPNSFLICRYAEKILRRVTGDQAVTIPDDVPDHLEEHGTWPVIPSVAERLSLPYCSQGFVIPHRGAGKHVSFEQYIEDAYRQYEETDLRLLENLPVH